MMNGHFLKIVTLDSDDEESNDLSFESDEHSGEVAGHNVPRFEIQSNSNVRVVERNEIDDDEIAIAQALVTVLRLKRPTYVLNSEIAS